MADFHPFAVAVNQQFVHLSKGELFTTEGEDDLFEVYLAAAIDGLSANELRARIAALGG